MDYSRDKAVMRFQARVHSLFGILFPDKTGKNNMKIQISGPVILVG